MIAREDEVPDLIQAGKNLGEVLEALAAATHAGSTTRELDTLAEKMIRDKGDVPAWKGYSPDGSSKGFPAALCISVNDEVVHGLPGARVIRDGDIVSLDLGLTHKGYIMDSAHTIPVGTVSNEAKDLMALTEEALRLGIGQARPGNKIGDISHAVEQAYKGSGFSIVKVLGGHGVGREVHEEPFIPNVGHAGTGPEIVEGMVLAIEPIANAGKASVIILPDGFTYRAKDGSLSAHFEHTIYVGKEETIVLTRRPSEK